MQIPQYEVLHLEDLRAIQPVSDALANNLRWVHKIVQDSVMHLTTYRIVHDDIQDV